MMNAAVLMPCGLLPTEFHPAQVSKQHIDLSRFNERPGVGIFALRGPMEFPVRLDMESLHH